MTGKKMKYKEMQKASKLKKGDYVTDIQLESDDCSIFIFDHMEENSSYFIPYYNCDEYSKTGDFIGFLNHFPCFKITKRTADKYIKSHEEKI